MYRSALSAPASFFCFAFSPALLASGSCFWKQLISRFIQPPVSTCRIEVPYEFACRLVNLQASKVIQLFAREVVNSVRTDVGDVLTFAVEYFSVHQDRFFPGRSTRTSRNSSGPVRRVRFRLAFS